jgi:hypothetical protein
MQTGCGRCMWSALCATPRHWSWPTTSSGDVQLLFGPSNVLCRPCRIMVTLPVSMPPGALLCTES